MIFHLRDRLALVFAALCGAVLVPFMAYVFLYLGAWLGAELKEEILHDRDQIRIVFGEHQALPGVFEELAREEADEFNIQIRVLDAGGRPLFHSYLLEERPFSIDRRAGGMPLNTDAWYGGEISGVPHRIVRSPVVHQGRTYHIEIWKSAAELIEIRRKILVIFAAGVPAILLFTIVTGRLFARRALAPVEALRRRAEEMESADLSARLPVASRQDELSRLAVTLNGLLSRIQATFEAMRRFTADASHELRIPLTNLRGIIEVNLRKKRTVEEHESDMRDALEEVDRLGALTDNLLMMAQIDAGKLKVAREPVDLKPLLSDAMEEARRLEGASGFSWSLAGAPDGTHLIDPELVRRILMILLDNAIKYTPAGGAITLGARATDEALEIAVENAGPSIPAQEREIIFERFYRRDQSRSRESGGSGLGLAIARSVAEAHGGRLTCEPGASGGNRFILRLPVRVKD